MEKRYYTFVMYYRNGNGLRRSLNEARCFYFDDAAMTAARSALLMNKGMRTSAWHVDDSMRCFAVIVWEGDRRVGEVKAEGERTAV